MKKIIWTIVSVAGLAGLCLLLGRSGGEKTAESVYAAVKDGALVISVEEYGEIAPSEQIELKNEVQGRSSIISLVPEGRMVKKGEVLIQLDVSSKIDEKDSQEIVLRNAESALEVAREALDIQKNQSASDVELAEQAYEFAKEDLDMYEKGEYPTRLLTQKGNLAISEQKVKQAKDKYEWSKKLFAEDFISETELEGDELSWKSSQLSFESAKRELELLETFTHRREMTKFRSDMRQKGMALERTRKRAASAVAQAESNLRAKESEFRKQVQRYDKITNQIAKATIRAPRDGQVVYASSRMGREPLQEGQEVWERQPLIILPTDDGFSAKINVHESSLKSVVTGMPVRVRCDALPGRVFSGTVSKIAPMPDNERKWMNPDLKVYPTQVLIADGKGELRNGMGCKAEIIIARYDNALHVPVQSVVRIAGESFVWVRTEGEDEQRKVETGEDNSRFIRILSGLKAGEEVSLSPPLSESAAGDDVEGVERK
jgi:HlyD family secretion protein